MANEISLSISASATKGGISITASASKSQTMEAALDTLHHTLQDVGLIKTQLSTGDIDSSKQYILLVINRDSTNYVTINVADGDDFAILLPGEFLLLRIKGTVVLEATANTAQCELEVWAVEAGDPTA